MLPRLKRRQELLRIDQQAIAPNLKMNMRTAGVTGAAHFAHRITAGDGGAGLDQCAFEVKVQGFQAVAVVNNDGKTQALLAPAGITDRTGGGDLLRGQGQPVRGVSNRSCAASGPAPGADRG